MEALHLAARISSPHAKKAMALLHPNPLAKRQSVVIVGGPPDGETVARRLLTFPENYEIWGIFDDRIKKRNNINYSVPFLGDLDDLLEFCRKNLPDIIVISIFSLSRERFLNIFQKIRVVPANIYLALQEKDDGPTDDEGALDRGFSVFLVEKQPLTGWDSVIKFLEDRILSFLALIVVSPLFVVISILIKCDSRGPVFFRQTRYGFNSNPIRIFKFRTMYADQADPTGVKKTVRDDPRVTRVGRYLRHYSLDELPQLLNVLNGDMSIVAPRAHVASMRVEDGVYEDVVKNYLIRHKIKPGITGLAQVRGSRGEITSLKEARRRLTYDLFYINHWSLLLDIKIIFMTIYIILRRNKNTY